MNGGMITVMPARWVDMIRWHAAGAAAALMATWFVAPVSAQVFEPRPSAARRLQPPELSEAVRRAIDIPYLSEQERSAKRVFHGVWTEGDLASPARRAKAALIAGVYDDRSLFDPAAEPADRAEAALIRGDPDRTLGLLAGMEGARALRLRAEAYEALGRFDEALAAVTPVVHALLTRRATDPAELVEGVRAMGVKARLEGRPGRDYQNMLDLLVQAQQQLDRLYWPALLAQAELLYDKDNSPEANKAIAELLSLNPSCAAAWALLGRLAVDSFNFDRVEQVAEVLNGLATRLDPGRDSTSPAGDLLQARARMRQSDALLAQELVQRVLDRFPSMREALALQAAAEALLFEYEGADELLAALDALSPGTPIGYFEVGRALSEARQYDRAAEYLEEASRRQPNWAPPVIELGLLEMQSGRDARALTALRRAVELDPFHTRARNSLTLVEELAAYETVEAPHFLVRFPRGVLGVMAREMVEPLEEIHRIVAGAIEHEPARKTTIELLPDHQTFAVRITGMTGIHTIAAATGPVIAMEAPKEGKRHQGVYDWVRVVRHEYTHTVTLSRTHNRIPHWFTEAAAVFLENTPRDYQTCQMLAAALTGAGGFHLFDMSEINIAFVRPKRPTDRGQAYAQGHWMYEFIVDRWGASAPLRMMDLYALGIREDQAMQRVLGVSQDAFLSQFESWARADAATWGMLPERSLHALLVEEATSDPATRAGIESDLAAFALGTAFTLSGSAGGREYTIKLPEPEGDMLDRILARAPDHPDALELKVQEELAARNGEPDEAMVPLLERYAAARPVDPMPHRHLARLYLAGAAPEKAIPHLEYLDAREQKSFAYAVELARRYAALGEFAKARAKAERATQIAPFDPANREIAATVCIQAGDLASAERHIEALTEIEPQHDLHRRRLERIREMRRKGS